MRRVPSLRTLKAYAKTRHNARPKPYNLRNWSTLGSVIIPMLVSLDRSTTRLRTNYGCWFEADYCCQQPQAFTLTIRSRGNFLLESGWRVELCVSAPVSRIG